VALYLLDTSIFVHAVRQSSAWLTQVVSTYDPMNATPRSLYSVVTEGELGSLSIQLSWGAGKQTSLQNLLAFFIRTDISHPAVLNQYALIDAHCKARGLSLGKNDLWIAATASATGATASATGATLLTTDKDFDSLHGVFLQRIWIDPN
jgi:tRNA(fMet)-specific endonuclease VapC